jgi:hypothetical protein
MASQKRKSANEPYRSREDVERTLFPKAAKERARESPPAEFGNELANRMLKGFRKVLRSEQP